MTADARRKRRVRARAAKTGESYTAALRHLRQQEESLMTILDITPAAITDRGHIRSTNQDDVLATGDLFAVADGTGDGDGGGPRRASQVAIEALEQTFANDRTATGLVAAIHAANTAVWELGQRSGADAERDGSSPATTIAAVARVGSSGQDTGGDAERLVLANVGDSRIYLFRAGELQRLSSDHSQVADLVRLGEITEQEAAVHPDRHLLTRALGAQPVVAPDVHHLAPEAGDRVLLCSDGLFNEVASAEIARILATVDDPDEAASALIEAAKTGGGSDNIAVVVLGIS